MKSQTKRMNDNLKAKSGNIYMMALPDGRWAVDFCSKKYGEDNGYIFITKEGKYPVTVYYERYDVMGSKVVVAHESHSRADLLYTLACCGLNRCRVLELWQHRLSNASDQKLFDLYAACDKRRYELAQEDIEAFTDT